MTGNDNPLQDSDMQEWRHRLNLAGVEAVADGEDLTPDELRVLLERVAAQPWGEAAFDLLRVALKPSE